jgi:hypothetical protein
MLLKEDKADICSPRHEWLMIPPPPTRKWEKDTIVVDGEALTVEEFKKRVREEWEI